MHSTAVLLVLAKATVVLVAALGLARALHRAAAGTRHLVWRSALGAVLLVPALAAWGPVRLAVLPPGVARLTASPVAEQNAALRSASGTRVGTEVGTGLATGVATAPLAGPGAGAGADADARSGDGSSFTLELPLAIVASLGAPRIALLAWSIVALAIGASLAHAWLSVRRIVRRARPLEDRAWMEPLWEIADRLSLDATPRLLRSDETRMPFACGIARPTIVLPAESDGWSQARRRAVLLHELAHVRRRDLVWHTLARVVCAVYWFHPLVWTAARRLRAESERACDDLALACGARAAEYAEHLLDIVTSVRHDATPLVALAMARRNEFEGRMLDILDPERPRTAGGRGQVAGLLGALGVVTVLVSAAAPVVPSVPADSVKQGSSAGLASHSAPVAAPAAAATPARDRAERGSLDGPAHRASDRLATASATASATPAATPAATSLPEPQAGPAPRPDPRPVSMPSPMASPMRAADPVPNPLPVAEPRPAASAARAAALRDLVSAALPRGARADERVELLARVLRTDSAGPLRRIAAWGLAQHAELATAVDALVAALRDDRSPEVREMAAWALSNARPTASRESLAAAVRGDPDARVRESAAWSLGNVGGRWAAEPLAAALGDTSAPVRITAAWALGNARPDQAPAALIALLRDREPGARHAAAWALYMIRDAASIPALRAAMRAESERQLRSEYVRALAALGERSVDALSELVASPDAEVRAVAVRALAGSASANPWVWPWPRPRPNP